LLNFKKKRRLSVVSQSKWKSFKNLKLTVYFKIFTFFFILFCFLILFFSPVFKISSISAEREDLSIDPTEIIQELNWYSWKNIFLISISSIENKLKEGFPRFQNISIKKSLPDTLILKISPYEDIFILKTYFTKKNEETWLKEKYLQSFLVSQSWELKNFIDDISSEENLLKTITSKEDTLEKINWWEVFFDADYFYKIQLIVNKLEQFYSLTVKDIYFYNDAQEIHIETNIWTIWINFYWDLSKQLKKISTIRGEFWEDKIFNYLDLRVFWKIIYK